MAEVDFSHARITPAGAVNPAAYSYVNLTNLSGFRDASDNSVASVTITTLVNQQKRFVKMFSGTFTASGTEFYIWQYSSPYGVGKWKVSNISFNSGDTFIFQIQADLICQ